jgi:Na+/H+ antiporter NhaD/arsenite permease-like protein
VADPCPDVLYALALVLSLSGNLLFTGSLRNVLIVERAGRMGAGLTFAEHARAGVPITIVSLGFAVLWLAATRTLPLLP